ncbi:DUF5606 domain-containing protein [Mucilaginibacter sp. L3T2-6]|uniref:DUF5606 family protein n=1 Tax=Mucilaginibacter sp. L3T2-6 TaxID=3062491 RepID=UPI0026765014|nr:DUF5606 domain-containing protein [Mucilaginibacter sp. L3T2-6]MDO3642649.1 DUF5606 domain-containing protein [Mucilaginibacter sp. L3T2-6]MDV6214955.1 DUF5606 domain-containing protein [Mucilaginibacter sp. L3T2-6]
MNLQGIVAVSGKPGLWRALAQNKTGYILESLDAQKTKLVANLSTAKLAALHEITIFGLEDDIKLTDVFERMKSASGVPDAKADGKALRTFFREVAPHHDEEKVYASDMKKIISWYNILKEYPLFNEPDPAEAPAEAAPAEELKPAEEALVAEETAPAKPKAKKATAKKA